MFGLGVRWSRRGLYLLLILTFLRDKLEVFTGPWVESFSDQMHAHLHTDAVTNFIVVPLLLAIAIFFDQVIVILFKLSLAVLAYAIWHAMSLGYCQSPRLLDGIVSCGMAGVQLSIDLASTYLHHLGTTFVRYLWCHVC